MKTSLVPLLVAASLGPIVLIAPAPALAEEGVCHAVDVSFRPQRRADLGDAYARAPQIVAWVENAAGEFVATAYITQATGTYGLGNRPGIFDHNSAPMWPYGRRVTTFPVWADKKPERFDAIVFQTGREDNLSHPSDESSREYYYCRPQQPSEVDAITCASPSSAYTDKGRRSSTEQSKYPPRQDVVFESGIDDPAVLDFNSMNPYDAISQATPPTGQLATIGWLAPPELPDGAYTLRVEVSAEFDHNAMYTKEAYPAPSNIPWSEYGLPYRGQPSVIYEVPFEIGSTGQTTRTTTYAGYGDPDGSDGVMRAPDATMASMVMGSGADRLGLVTDPAGDFRVRVQTRIELDSIAPAAPQSITLVAATSRKVTLAFAAPGDDGLLGTVRMYEVRYRQGSAVTEENWDDATSFPVVVALPTLEAGQMQALDVVGLLPLTSYSIGVRALDDCGNRGPVSSLDVTTPDRTGGEVDACFVATAAYGSSLAGSVVTLRHMRDSVLRKSVLGELAVEAYYTFSPAVAGAIGESDLLRGTARALLRPVVAFALRIAPWR